MAAPAAHLSMTRPGSQPRPPPLPALRPRQAHLQSPEILPGPRYRQVRRRPRLLHLRPRQPRQRQGPRARPRPVARQLRDGQALGRARRGCDVLRRRRGRTAGFCSDLCWDLRCGLRGLDRRPECMRLGSVLQVVGAADDSGAMMKLYVGLYTNIGFHDFALNSQSPTLGFELFANMKFLNVLCKNMLCKILNQMDPKDIIASGATIQSHMLHDKATEFSRELNQANACTLLSNYGHGKMKRLVQESEETNGKCTAPAITPIVSEGNEQVLFINIILQVLDLSTYSVDNLDVLSHDLGENGFVALHLILCLLNNGESKTMVINWLSKVKTHAGSSTLNVDTVKVSHHLEDKSDVLRATQMTNLEEKNDLFPYFLHWGITLIVFYSEFVSAISNYDCFLYNNLGAAFDKTMTLQLVSIVAYALGTSLHAFHRD